MKKRVLILVSVLLLFTFIVNVYASENNSTNSEVDEIMFLAEDIVNEVNSVASEEGDTKTFTSDDILFKQATKVYVGLDIFKINNVSHNVNAALKDCPYIWIVPIQSDKKQIMVTVNQTSPFDKEKGIWKFGGISFDDVNSLSYMDYTETLYKETLKSDRQEKTVFYIGGIPNVRYPIGFVMTDKIEKLIFTDDPITSVKITSHARTQSIEKNKVYDYI
ncbi:MAG: hypothetical protein MJA31_18325, partial [Clostridia bacterium]|nr:hypothetical protein [Clostridia bacterium]